MNEFLEDTIAGAIIVLIVWFFFLGGSAMIFCGVCPS
jgi:multidrug efflux pump subunit AcrB